MHYSRLTIARGVEAEYEVSVWLHNSEDPLWTREYDTVRLAGGKVALDGNLVLNLRGTSVRLSETENLATGERDTALTIEEQRRERNTITVETREG